MVTKSGLALLGKDQIWAATLGRMVECYFGAQIQEKIKHAYNKAFGGVNIIACGDLSQLKPVGW